MDYFHLQIKIADLVVVFCFVFIVIVYYKFHPSYVFK